MHPNKVDRTKVKLLTDLPNVGPALAKDLRLLGYHFAQDVTGACPFAMYERLCAITNARHDPCVIDVFMSITDFLNGAEPRPWWHFTKERKAHRASAP